MDKFKEYKKMKKIELIEKLIKLEEEKKEKDEEVNIIITTRDDDYKNIGPDQVRSYTYKNDEEAKKDLPNILMEQLERLQISFECNDINDINDNDKYVYKYLIEDESINKEYDFNFNLYEMLDAIDNSDFRKGEFIDYKFYIE